MPVREQVQKCYETSAEYDVNRDSAKLDELGAKITNLAPEDAIIVASSISHMLNLANLAEEVQIAYRRAAASSRAAGSPTRAPPPPSPTSRRRSSASSSWAS
jgi:phosphoenolpyruvate carboxylase